jgi:hypothetical protein
MRETSRVAAASRRLLAIGIVLALFGLGAGCAGWRKTAWEAGLGSFATDLSVVSVAPHGDYLEATLAGHGLSLTLFAPNDAACAGVLAPEATLNYVERGIAGRLEREGARCDAVGIGPPFTERAREPRRQSLRSTPIPRAQASFRILHQDDELVLLRGRFPLAFHVGWAGGDDSVVAVPADPVCRAAAEDGVASMEYRPTGRSTLVLIGRDALCGIVGLMLPPGQLPAEEDR